MEKDRSHMTERILSLTLEIIYLLTGEDYAPVKFPRPDAQELGEWIRRQSPIIDPSPHPLIHERDNDQKILELTNNIIHLLTGEVPIRCQDVAVYFSMEEWEYIEGHQDLYKDVQMENHQTSLDTDTTPHTPTEDQMNSEDRKTCDMVSTCEVESDPVHQPALESKADATTDTPGMSAEPRERSSVPIKKETTMTDKQCFNQESCEPEQHPDYSPPEIPGSFLCKEEDGGVFPGDQEDFDYLYITEDGDTHMSSSIESVVTCIECYDHFTIESHDPCDQRAQPYKCPKCSTAHSDLMCSTDDTQIVTFSELLSGERNTVNNGEEIVSRNKCDIKNNNYGGKRNDSYPGYNTSNMSYHRISMEEKSLSRIQYEKCFNQQTHMDTNQRVHTEGKPFPCPQTGKHIVKKPPFISHQTTRTDSNQYSCLECGKCFKQSVSLTEHMRTHRGAEVFTEPQSFSQHSFSCLQKHHNAQKLFICFECGKCFRTKSDLTTHHRIHMGEKPFPCPQCGEGFTRRANLVRHQRIHTGEKPFSCPYCGKCFTRKLGLMKHQSIHTEQRDYRKLHREMFPHTMC